MLVDRSPTRGTDVLGAGTTQNQPGSNQTPQGREPNGGVSMISSRHIELPPFYQADPRLWFAQVDLVFANYNITSDITKFKYVATQLSGEALRSVSDLVINPPAQNKYESIKRRVMSAYDKGDEARLRRLLRGHEMRDEKLTAYLHRLRALAGDQCGDAVIRSLFFKQLPEAARAILAISDTSDLQRLAEMADKALDVMRPMMAATQIVPAKSPNTQATSGTQSTLEELLNALTLQVSKIQKQLDRNKRFRRSRSRGRKNQPRALTPAPTHSNKPEFCYYHNRFGASARKCQNPCTWTQGAKPQEN
ncbi:uncharacterized protein LOC114936001 [Nylanderia fulva]|uniref:uncharacterized protein LOC114936001 n=1 Tax=Nylanderia fulva TaxID=613905 RepID=UPI0010FB73A2|nr:uncharacterized protein LOC114936001 [Nylanderia fulva]